MVEEKKFYVGYVLLTLSKKQNNFIRDLLVNLVKSHSIGFVRVDQNQNLTNQRNHDWKCQLMEFNVNYPNVVILNSPKSTKF